MQIINKIYLKEAVGHIYQSCQGKGDNTPFFFIVGAGISAPIVKTAGQIIEDCKKIAIQNGRTEEDIETISAMSEYSYWFKNAYPNKIQRQEYLKNLIEGKEITPANLRLSHILSSKIISNLVVTPNFDDFISRGLNIFGENCVVCDHPKTIEKINLEDKKNIQIVHVHGTYQFYDCCNLDKEINDVANTSEFMSIKSFLRNLLWRQSPIVVGYSGWENDVIMTTLKERLQGNSLPTNIYWFCYKEENIDLLPEWLKNEHVYFVIPEIF